MRLELTLGTEWDGSQRFSLRCGGGLLALSSYSQGLPGVLFVTGVSPLTLALVYDSVEHNLSGERSVEDWPLLCWRKKVGFFHHSGTYGHLVVEGAQPEGTYRKENRVGIESIARLLVYVLV